MITSKLTSKAQTMIPLPVRNALRVGEGDEIAYRIDGDHEPSPAFLLAPELIVRASAVPPGP